MTSLDEGMDQTGNSVHRLCAIALWAMDHSALCTSVRYDNDTSVTLWRAWVHGIYIIRPHRSYHLHRQHLRIAHLFHTLRIVQSSACIVDMIWAMIMSPDALYDGMPPCHSPCCGNHMHPTVPSVLIVHLARAIRRLHVRP